MTSTTPNEYTKPFFVSSRKKRFVMALWHPASRKSAFFFLLHMDNFPRRETDKEAHARTGQWTELVPYPTLLISCSSTSAFSQHYGLYGTVRLTARPGRKSPRIPPGSPQDLRRIRQGFKDEPMMVSRGTSARSKQMENRLRSTNSIVHLRKTVRDGPRTPRGSRRESAL